MSFTNNFKNKVVLVTGNTGFKGSWLSLWLNLMGAKVIGVSKDIPTIPSHYKLNNKFYMKNEKFDLSNKKLITKIIKNSKPDYIFHLAAQAIVLESYSDPYATYQSNTVGTLNILESLKESNHKCTAISVSYTHLTLPTTPYV